MANPAKDARDKVKAKYPDAVVSRRGHKCIEHTVPSIPGKVVSDYSIGPFHYGLDYDQEIDTAWEAATAPWDHKMVEAGYNAYALANFSFGQIIKYVDPVSGEDIAFEPQGLYYSNDLDDEQEIVDAPQSVMATVTDDELYWTGAYGSGIDIRWLAGTASLYKGIIIARASDLPPVEQYIIDGGNPVLRVQFIFQHSQGVNVWVNGIKWDEKPNNPVETSGYVEFKDLSEKPLWAFDLPRSITADNDDPEQREIISVFRLRKTGPNLIVEHRISIDWLLSAVYPVEIDTTINEQVGASLDDAKEISSVMTLDDGSSYIDETDEYLGMRWSSVTIGAGAEIDVADVDVWFLSPNYDEPDHAVWFEDSGSPGQFAADDNDISSRTPTTATTMLSDANLGVVPGGNWLSELVYGKQDVKSIVEELVASYDYSGGAPMVCIMQGSANAARDLSIGTYDFSGNVWGGKLHIEFTPAAPAGQPTQVRTQGVPTGSGARDRIGRWN